MVIEAKREGIYFELPAGFDKRVCKLSTLFQGNQQIERAIRQSLDYSLERGIPFAAVCNGHQLIAFVGSRSDGIPPLDGQCLIFRSLRDMQADFRTLWDNLSKPGVLAHMLHSTLRVEGIQPPPEKLTQRIPGYPGFKNRNPFQTDLKILGELFIEDVVQAPQLEDDFLRECYCLSGALSQYALISKQILQSRYSTLFEKELEVPELEPAQTKRGLSDDFTTDVLAASLKRRAIILLGDVGVGKTIFIRHLMRVSARDVFERALPLYVDFGKEPALAEDLEDFVLRRCADQLLKDHRIDIEENNFVRGVYHSELTRFRKGIFASLAETNPAAYGEKEIEFLREKLQNRAPHLRACLNHISKGHLRQVVIFLDNVDQRPIEFQDRAFLIGQSLAETWPATVFISLRPDTFFESKTKGSLAAYQPRVFTIAPPRVDQVISKRLEFVLSTLESTGRLSSLPQGLTFASGSLVRYIEVLIESFQASKDLIQFIDNLSGGNTRQALGFITAFIGSGHVNAEKILNISEESGGYTIPIHEFIRAVTYGDFEHYDPAASPVVNIFDISSTDGREHFLLPNVLAFIQRTGDVAGKDGFVEARRIYEFCQNLGFTPIQIEFALERARSKKLLETFPRFANGPAISYRITSAGAYTFQELPKQFSYIDAMIVDTPIVDPSVRGLIGDAQDIAERSERAILFMKYLDTQWQLLALNQVAFDWPSASAAAASQIARIREIQRLKEASREASRKIRPT